MATATPIASQTASAESDFTLEFVATNLHPSTTYQYEIKNAANAASQPMSGALRTLPKPGEPARLVLAMGSCANDKVFKEQKIWTAIAATEPDGLLLLGDTPYIDSSSLKKQRERRQAFLQIDGLMQLRQSTPSWATWDDHDFGKPDGDGRMEGKDLSRQAFLEYSANDSNGEDGEGIYTKFRFGDAEIFLIDTRYFSRAEPSFANPDQLTLIGRQQWEWLKRELKASDATFKVLASGMIWNEAVRPLKDDYWMAYLHERAAVLKFIADEKISGVVLVGGDIHRNRALKHETPETGIAYPLYEIIASPLANTVIEAANQPHPGLLFDSGVQQSAVLLTVDSMENDPTLEAKWINEKSEVLFVLKTTASELKPVK